jgi:hypothetical protein
VWAQEAARDLVRAREDVRGDLMRTRHRVSQLVRHGIVITGGRRGPGDTMSGCGRNASTTERRCARQSPGSVTQS